MGSKITDQEFLKIDEKIETVKNATERQNTFEVRNILALVTFYGKFVPNLTTIAAPLYNLMRKDVPFKIDQECNFAFQKLKRKLCSDRVLTYYNSELPIKVVRDVSPVEIGGVLAHIHPNDHEQQIAFASRILSKANVIIHK